MSYARRKHVWLNYGLPVTAGTSLFALFVLAVWMRAHLGA